MVSLSKKNSDGVRIANSAWFPAIFPFILESIRSSGQWCIHQPYVLKISIARSILPKLFLPEAVPGGARFDERTSKQRPLLLDFCSIAAAMSYDR